MIDNLITWEKVKAVPTNAKKSIPGGRLKGMTDINPVWRLQMLTELFGPVGFGWYYDIVEKEIVEGANGEQVAFIKINLFVADPHGEWSKPIVGLGGSSFIAKEKNGLYTSDECFKMALTDAISVSCKALGIGADVYWEGGQSKYNKQDEPSAPNNSTSTTSNSNTNDLICTDCSAQITPGIQKVSTKKYGKALCMPCQKKQEK